ncbi:MAG: Fur family transcriptional regulator [Myxococcota bacterium]|jgi:Fur family ferric uptake transcriptional regulator|nr:Fur family transcriptional regulator [Myxococcota bacterium]
MKYEAERTQLSTYLSGMGLKHTKQRDVILTIFLDSDDHVSAEDLYQRVRKKSPSIGYTTVYRTLKLFVDAGLAQEHRFDDGLTRYENEHAHHDHLVCLDCGKIIEFNSELIEDAQEKVAVEYGFKVLHHRHELYGRCSDCENKSQ